MASHFLNRRQETLDAKAGQTERGDTTGVMAWERRERGRLYNTRSQRVDGRVVRKYVGGGLLGELAACRDAEQRRHREEEAARGRAAVERLEDLAAPLGELWEAVEVLARAHLIAAGYHRHKREWRLRRGHG
jgi:hypothetical protein